MSGTLAFLRALYGDLEDVPGELVVSTAATTRDGRRYYKPERWTRDLAPAARCIEAQADREDVYVGLALQDRRRALAHKRAILERNGEDRPATDRNTRGFALSTSALTALFVDLDLYRPGGHATDALPRTAEDVQREWRRAVPFDPTAWVHSGGGLYAFLAFREPWLFAPSDQCAERARAATLARALQAAIRRVWTENGWLLDPTADLARVFRPVGSINRKRGERVPVRLLEASGVRYDPSEIEDGLPADMLAEAHRAPVASRGFVGQGRPADLVPIVAGCRWMRHVRDAAATLPEPEWYAALGILARCAEGERAAHEWSAPYPRYNADEATAKLEQAARASGPARCARITATLDTGGHCAGCVARENGAVSPISLGYQTEARRASSSAVVSAWLNSDEPAVTGGAR